MMLENVFVTTVVGMEEFHRYPLGIVDDAFQEYPRHMLGDLEQFGFRTGQEDSSKALNRPFECNAEMIDEDLVEGTGQVHIKDSSELLAR